MNHRGGESRPSAATEAIGEPATGDNPTPPAADAVLAFLAAAAKAAPQESKLDANTTRITRQNDASVLSETKAFDGKVIHRSVVAF